MPALDPEHLKSILDSKDKTAQKSRVGVKGYVHASTLTAGVCPRHYAINVLYDRIDFETVTGGHRLMWAYGRAAEAHIRGNLTDGQTYGYQVYGQWKCACEASVHVGTRPKPGNLCNRCGTEPHNYHEQPWFDHENRFVGNPDLGLFIGRFYFPVEIKSMTAEQWKKLEAPLATHINQAILYRYLAKREGLMVHSHVLIVYACKEFKFGSPYKIFSVDATVPAVEAMLARSLELASTIRDAVATTRLPARQATCTALDDRTPKKCPAGVTCFNLPA